MHSGLAKQFETLWESSRSPPDVFAFLEENASADASDKLAVLVRDQQRRWKTDRPLHVEDYLAQLPALRSDPDVKLRLAVGEFRARQISHSSPQLDEFTSRFADIRPALCDELSALTCAEDVAHEQQRFATTTSYIAEAATGDLQFGRYRIMRVLGEGGYGRVYLGFDEELRRPVAIKVPMPKRFKKPADAEAYLAEARTVAGLDHPNIVPVHDVGRLEDGSIYVVSKFIHGRALRDVVKEARPGFKETARLLATIARALCHAHSLRLVHRDVKPANILIDANTGAPYITDFGLAIREEVFQRQGRIVGTPAYMSPEQASGEGHRLDGRSDIFSLGVVMYELLTGKRPFRGSTDNELYHQVISVDPIPPRERDPSIPAELERICLKALAKRASDRYATADKLADDLVHWEQGTEQNEKTLKIVPKGLRSFDANDADFFLDLLPGPRDREGIPESIRFWKVRIETSDPDDTFSIGMIYGPSGCGKSSLVKAGLLPLLSKEVLAIYVESVLDETEMRILRSLRRSFPDLPADIGLAETLALLRRLKARKVVLVLDQFEQWLHVHQATPESELVRALRQCDGETLQAIVMVRDDFAMAAARFMDCVDVPILQGQNFATVDFFGIDHAEKVLTKFGQAFGRLPDRASHLTDEQQAFVKKVVAGLAHDGKVVSVRLALFAEMVKSKPWAPATLEEVGGTEGIGVSFLEEMFCSRSANPKHRIHQQAACDVLTALLPEIGTDIKGHMRSHFELMEASGYQSRPAEFHELLRILDGELRLITPTDPVESLTDSASNPSLKYYQLTHDYLVAALRQWLTRKQRQTRRGRAEIQLDERTRLWSARPEVKQLPSAREWINIRLHTVRDRWSAPQRAMMLAATKHHLSHMLQIAAIVLVVAAAGAIWWRTIESAARADRVKRLVGDLWRTKYEHLPAVLTELEPHRARWQASVESVANNADSTADQRTRGYLALVRKDGKHMDYLRQRMLEVDVEQHLTIRDELRPWKQELSFATWDEFRRGVLGHEQLIRAAAILADYAPEDVQWPQLAQPVTDALVLSDPFLVNPWIDALYPIRLHLITPLIDVLKRVDSRPDARTLAAGILARFLSRDETLLSDQELSDLLLDAEPTAYRILEAAVQRRRDSFLPIVRQQAREHAPLVADDAAEKLLGRQANALETLYRTGEVEPFWNHLGDEADPRLRTLLIDRIAFVARDWRQLLGRIEQEANPRIRQAVVMGLAGYQRELSEQASNDLTERLIGLYQTDPDAGVHSAAEWMLRSLGGDDRMAAERQRLAKNDCHACNWTIEANGLTMVHINPPGLFQMGSPEGEPGRDSRTEGQREVSISYPFAIGTREITLRQFLEYQSDLQYDIRAAPDLECPANKVDVYDAMKFCRWLSEQEPDFESAACCYPPIPQIGPGMDPLPDDFCVRPGYRLPTIAEWEYAARAGARTSRFFGSSPSHLNLYCWSSQNAGEVVQPVGRLRPSPLGLFDVYGNVSEWCHKLQPRIEPTGNSICGGDYRATPRFLRSAAKEEIVASARSSAVGFRVVKISPVH